MSPEPKKSSDEGPDWLRPRVTPLAVSLLVLGGFCLFWPRHANPFQDHAAVELFGLLMVIAGIVTIGVPGWVSEVKARLPGSAGVLPYVRALAATGVIIVIIALLVR